MNIVDQYPSTYDLAVIPGFPGLPPIAGGQDATLAILEGARKRYARSMSTAAYISKGGSVCAIGAIAREDGLKPNDVEGYYSDNIPALFERRCSEAAREAIDLLNSAALEIYPDAEHRNRDWSGPLEYINQELPRRKAKKTVLECYDLAISRRRAVK